ncbi:MAG: LysR substrate-binding domain-containing protein, partial [Pseudomonadota bacterium]
PASPGDLAQHSLLSFSLAEHARRWALSGPDGSIDLPIVPRHLVGNSLFLRDLLISGLGIGALPDFLADAAAKEGRLERVLPDFELPERSVFAVTATRLSADAKARAFIDFLRETIGRDC